ncbi:MAG: ankyrin repeat domain-containing protein [Rhodospirillales bacterium]|nr:ankyrin repeat domain-containing protein [Rhodospirillales bacterium]
MRPATTPTSERPPSNTVAQQAPVAAQVTSPAAPPAIDRAQAVAQASGKNPPPPTNANPPSAETTAPTQTSPAQAPATQAPPAFPAKPPPPPTAPRTDRIAWLLDEVANLDPVLERVRTAQPNASGAPADARQAELIQRLRANAEQGYQSAQFALGVRLLLGEGLPANQERGEAWIRRSAERGYAPAQLMMGYHAAEGRKLTQPDLGEAFRWWSLAAARGNVAAKTGLPVLEDIAPAEEVRIARREAQRIDLFLSTNIVQQQAPGERKPLEAQLSEAAAEGSLAAVQSALARGADVNGTDTAGRTAMINAAWRGRTEIVDLLLLHGAETDFPDGEGKTSLTWAASNGHASVIRQLLESGAEVDHADSEGRTPLIRAAWNGYAEIVKALLDRGADPRVVDREGQTARDYALKFNRTEIIRLLARSPMARRSSACIAAPSVSCSTNTATTTCSRASPLPSG